MSRLGYKWGMLALLIVVGAINYCDRSAITAVFPLLRSDLRMSDLELAGIGSFFLWSYALASPVAGAIADRLSRKQVIAWSLAAAGLLTLAVGFVRSAPQLLFLRVVLGIVEAAYLPAAMAMLADYHRTSTRATAIGLHSAGLALGLVAGGTAAGYIGKHFGWRPGFFALGGLGLALAGVCGLLLRTESGHVVAADLRAAESGGLPSPASAARRSAATSLSGFGDLFRHRTFVIILLASIVAAAGNNIFINWLPLYFKETFGLSLPQAGLAGTFALNAAAIVGLVVGSVVSDRLVQLKPERRLLIRVVTCVMAAPFLIVFFSARTGLFELNMGIFCFAVIYRFGDGNEGALICDLLPPRLRSTAFGLQNCVNCLSGGLGVEVAGYLKSRTGLGSVFGGISGLTLLAAAILLVGYLFFAKRDLARNYALS